MSEFVVEEEPDPLPLREYNINLETGLAYDGLLSNSIIEEVEASLTPEMLAQEQHDVWRLTDYVDELLPSQIESIIQNGDVRLKRKRSVEDERILYFFVDEREGRPYCRSWTRGGQRVNWCQDELRHEPAADVLEHLRSTFEGLTIRESAPLKEPRHFGSYVLAKLLQSS